MNARPEIDQPSAPLHMAAESFDAFYRQEYPGQFKRAVLLLGSQADAADSVAQAFTKVYEKWDRVHEPGPYLNRAVLNACRDVGRRRRRLDVVDAPTETSSTDSYDSGELTRVLLSLPYKQRAVVVLKHWGGLREQDIADLLDIAPGSVGPTLARAHKRLKPLLGGLR